MVEIKNEFFFFVTSMQMMMEKRRRRRESHNAGNLNYAINQKRNIY